jgi:hypothetical protein
MIYVAEVYRIWPATTNWFGAWTNTAYSCCNRSYTDSDIHPLIVIFPFRMLMNIWVTWRVSYERQGSPLLPIFSLVFCWWCPCCSSLAFYVVFLWICHRSVFCYQCLWIVFFVVPLSRFSLTSIYSRN